jgi:hypothetical protein
MTLNFGLTRSAPGGIAVIFEDANDGRKRIEWLVPESALESPARETAGFLKVMDSLGKAVTGKPAQTGSQNPGPIDRQILPLAKRALLQVQREISDEIDRLSRLIGP